MGTGAVWGRCQWRHGLLRWCKLAWSSSLVFRAWRNRPTVLPSISLPHLYVTNSMVVQGTRREYSYRRSVCVRARAVGLVIVVLGLVVGRGSKSSGLGCVGREPLSSRALLRWIVVTSPLSTSSGQVVSEPYRPPKRVQLELDDWRDMGGEPADEDAEVSLRSLSMDRFSGDEARAKWLLPVGLALLA